MKLTKRDKLIVLVISLALIWGLGYFLLISPITTEVKASKAALDKATTDKTALNDKIELIPGFQNQINEYYNNSKSMTEYFVDSMVPYQVDQYMQPFLKDNKIAVSTAITFEEPTTNTVNYYYFTPNALTYPIYQAADINGNLAKQRMEELKDVAFLSNRQTEDVEFVRMAVDYKAKKNDILKFVDDIKAIDKAIRISEMSITDYTFGLNDDDPENDDYSQGKIIIEFYTVQNMEKPSFN